MASLQEMFDSSKSEGDRLYWNNEKLGRFIGDSNTIQFLEQDDVRNTYEQTISVVRLTMGQQRLVRLVLVPAYLSDLGDMIIATKATTPYS